jgi:hypothetical protein
LAQSWKFIANLCKFSLYQKTPRRKVVNTGWYHFLSNSMNSLLSLKQWENNRLVIIFTFFTIAISVFCRQKVQRVLKVVQVSISNTFC